MDGFILKSISGRFQKLMGTKLDKDGNFIYIISISSQSGGGRGIAHTYTGHTLWSLYVSSTVTDFV